MNQVVQLSYVTSISTCKRAGFILHNALDVIQHSLKRLQRKSAEKGTRESLSNIISWVYNWCASLFDWFKYTFLFSPFVRLSLSLSTHNSGYTYYVTYNIQFYNGNKVALSEVSTAWNGPTLHHRLYICTVKTRYLALFYDVYYTTWMNRRFNYESRQFHDNFFYFFCFFFFFFNSKYI